MSTANIWTGQYAGSGASQQIRLNQKPVLILIFDATAWTLNFRCKGMPSTAFITLACTDFSWSKTLSNGISFTATGFTVGASAKVNADGHTYNYLAVFGN